jgi:eukaryotic-like serine/threonine-protein kinase
MFDLQNIKTIGRYQILKKLGQGSVGVVYLGKDPYIERHVAIKVYRLPNDTGPEEI